MIESEFSRYYYSTFATNVFSILRCFKIQVQSSTKRNKLSLSLNWLQQRLGLRKESFFFMYGWVVAILQFSIHFILSFISSHLLSVHTFSPLKKCRNVHRKPDNCCIYDILFYQFRLFLSNWWMTAMEFYFIHYV